MQNQAGKRHNNCLNTLAIIDYISRHNGRPKDLLYGLEKELHGQPDPLSFLKDINNWVSSDVCNKMYANARLMTNDPRVAFKIGYESVIYKRLGYVDKIFIRALSSPRQAVKRVKRINGKFNRNKDIEIKWTSRTSALVRLRWYEGLNLNNDFCLVNQGIYSALPTMWGLPPGKVTETRCHFNGAPYCEFDLNWEELAFLKRFKMFFSYKKELASNTINEIEQSKLLLEKKYSEVEALNSRLQQKIDQLLSIQQTSQTILSEINYSILLPAILNIFINEIGYTRGLIMLVDYDSNTLKFIDGVGIGNDAENIKSLRGYSVPLSRNADNLLAKVATTGKPVIADDISDLELNPDNIIINQFNPKSIIVLPLMAQGKIIGILGADRHSEANNQAVLDKEYLLGFANQIALAIENARMFKELKDGFFSTMQALAGALEAKDAYTRGHSERVSSYSVLLAKKIGLSEIEVEHIRRTSLVHDIGKIGISKQILHKNSQLMDHEIEHIRRHPEIGENIIKPLNLSPDEISIVKHHHERYDGSGYPEGLSNIAIPVHVRIVTLCDAFDAMTSDRPYRKGLPVPRALGLIEQESGIQFDPDLVPLFVDMINQGEAEEIISQVAPPVKEQNIPENSTDSTTGNTEVLQHFK
ncbi:MAG: HD domain-containing protein [Desulfobacterales bacterium]|jgi:HD-GYP domain-containing protein (c-di-GMP phosphodiesterase class II)|nr:HD domain-containing protein [Desulfobacteraceae bacterium]MBT4363335.1 HD domain-containing protein [Desulfobacteraceae bacterium]MBT7085855.1 HD domain-containing protein [Desulfobacterales bacterium]MBT7697279.1 HD domain-containing protein [Desulfobacterales bacterium]